ncbi:hypothetical protein VCHENC03_4430 [Vibrio sp. HENC-03]|nr:hypothetical protein VCHENC03_4430 [Vibrio sp. HENC-03]
MKNKRKKNKSEVNNINNPRKLAEVLAKNQKSGEIELI